MVRVMYCLIMKLCLFNNEAVCLVIADNEAVCLIMTDNEAVFV